MGWGEPGEGHKWEMTAAPKELCVDPWWGMSVCLREQWDRESLLRGFFPCLFYPHKLWCPHAVALGAVWNLPACSQSLLGSFY